MSKKQLKWGTLLALMVWGHWFNVGPALTRPAYNIGVLRRGAR